MAKGRIAGITIEIGGDTKKLQDSLKDVNKSLGDTSRSLKDVDKLLKLDPKNTELLTQKQGYLKDAINATKEKLAQEQEALKQLKENDASGEVTEKQKALEREIIETKSSLEKLTGEYKEFGSVGAQKLKQVGESMKDLGGKMQQVGKSITTHVTAPIAGIGGASMVAWKEVDEAMDIVVEKTGVADPVLSGLKDTVKEIATEIPTDFKTAADAVGEVNTRFGATGDELKNLSEKFIEFAKINKTDVSTSIDKTQKLMETFGIDAADASDVLDTLNKVGQDTGIGMDKLTDSMLNNAGSLQEMGYSASDSARFVGQLETSGANASDVLAGMKKALVNATKQGKPMSDAMKEMQDSIQNAGSDTEAAQKAMELFGSKAGPAIAKAVRDGKLSFDELGTSLSDYAGSVQNTFEETLSPVDKLTTAMNQAKILGADIIDTAAPMITEALETLRDVIGAVADKWNGLDDSQKELIVKLGLVAAAIGPVITVVGGLVTGIGGVISIITGPAGLVAAAGTIGPALAGIATAAAPFLLGGAIVAGVIAAGVAIVKNWDWIRDTAVKLAEGAKQKWEELKTNTAAAWDNMKTNMTTKFETAVANVKAGAGNIADTVRTKFDEAKTNAQAAFQQLQENARSNFDNAFSAVQSRASDIANAVRSRFDEAKNTASAAAGDIWSTVTSKFSAMVGPVEGNLSSIASSIGSNLTGAFNTARDAIDWVKDKLESFVWQFPRPKLPHFSLNWGYLDILGQTISYPTGISVDWYKKAYGQPIMFTDPTVLQTPYGLKGFGDGNGGEIVLSDAKLREIVGGAGDTINNIYIYGAPGQDINALADAVQSRLVALQRQKEAAGLA